VSSESDQQAQEHNGTAAGTARSSQDAIAIDSYQLNSQVTLPPPYQTLPNLTKKVIKVIKVKKVKKVKKGLANRQDI
jgi:hypothetical protein